LSHNGASDAQASVYLWVGVAIGIYVRAQVCKPGYCLYCLIDKPGKDQDEKMPKSPFGPDSAVNSLVYTCSLSKYQNVC